MTVIPIVIGVLGTVSQGFGKGTGIVERMNQDHPDYSIVEIGQNTEKSPGDLRRLAVPLSPLKIMS